MSDQNSDPDFNVTDPVFAWAARAPNAVALIEQGRAISYRTLTVAIRRAMLSMREAGWRDGDVIGVSIRGETLLHLVVTLALARIGLTQVNLPPGDPVSQRLALAQRLSIKALVANHEDDRLSGIAQFTPDNDWIAAVHTAPVSPDSRGAGGDNTWIIIQSSGTTGMPKNIEISHHAERVRREQSQPLFSCQSGERVMNLVGLRFWVGISRAVRCLSEGGTVIALPDNFSAAQLLHWIDAYDVTYLSCTPRNLHWLLQRVNDDNPRLPGLRILRCSGAELVLSLLQQARRRLSPNLFIDYSSNEAGGMAAATPGILENYPDSVGLPLQGVELEIVDGEGRRAPTGVVGRIRVRGSGMTHCTEGVSIQAGWHYPGDTALQNDEGIVFLKGRYDDAINFDGILISTTEIESVLARHPSVAEVAAFALPSPEHQDVPAVALVLKQALTQEDLDQYCAQYLGIIAPRVFIRVDELPRNAMGKVLRRRLTEIALERLSAK